MQRQHVLDDVTGLTDCSLVGGPGKPAGASPAMRPPSGNLREHGPPCVRRCVSRSGPSEDPPPERAAALELVSESEGMTVPRKNRPFVEGRGRRQRCWGAFPGNVGPLGTVVVIRVVGKGPDGVTHRTVTGCTDVAPGAPRSLRGVCSCWGVSSEGPVAGDVPRAMRAWMPRLRV